MEKVKKIITSFSLFDCEYPTFEKSGGILAIEFEDWKSNKVNIYFHETVAFKWQESFCFLENEKDGSCYEILHSSWIAQHVKQGIIDENDLYKHYRFNFHDNGQLEVISIGFLNYEL